MSTGRDSSGSPFMTYGILGIAVILVIGAVGYILYGLGGTDPTAASTAPGAVAQTTGKTPQPATRGTDTRDTAPKASADDHKEIVRLFLEEFGSGKVDAAYDRTSRNYQRDYTRSVFENNLNNKLAAAQDGTVETLTVEEATPELVVVTAIVKGSDGTKRQVTVDLIPEDGAWKIDQLLIF